VECREGFGGGERVVAGYLEIFPGSPISYLSLLHPVDSNTLFVHVVLRSAESPNTSLRILQLLQQCLSVRVVVLVDDNLRLVVPFRHLDWSPAQNGYAADALLSEHIVEY
jgi:hypothetical protein